ncbi:MAG: hypothetical protein CFH39_01479, partial [Alphaproteobacteria bacterium MarineAlpha10_Bin2]
MQGAFRLRKYHAKLVQGKSIL